MKALGGVIWYHVNLTMRNIRYWITTLTFAIFIFYLWHKGAIFDDPSVFVTLGIAVLMYSHLFNPVKIGKLLYYKPNSGAIAILISIIATFPVIFMFSYVYPNSFLLNFVVFSLLALLPLSTSLRLRMGISLFGAFLLLILDKKNMLIGYFVLLALYLTVIVIKNRMVGVYFVGSSYISTLSAEVRLLLLIFSVAYIVVVGYIESLGIPFRCGFWECETRWPPWVILDPRNYIYVKITAILAAICLSTPLLWPFLLGIDYYMDYHLIYLHYLRPEGYLRRLFKEVVLFSLSLILPIIFYSSSISVNTLAGLIITFGFARVVMSLILTNFEDNAFLVLYSIIVVAPFIWAKFFSPWLAIIGVFLAPLAYKVRLQLEGE
ncbi:hypothetical protein PFDSM3638_05470 [Pyrococcus furiosus DSM 3638]|nr:MULTISPECIES: hypothetical protein [Pyrococcus]MDK2868786.1 hypothetical protein [Pyrococcus sp.]QEK78748.1 hypothetical protein PFDSM3638_05470 [Pyrococcus furiosus DSM 3638]